MAPSHVLAIDQGTTGTTALVLDGDARIVGRSYAEFPQHYPQPGWVEHDPSDLYDVSVRVARRALTDAGVAAGDLSGLGITNQRETTLVWDRCSGRPLANAIVWQDRRTAGICARLRSDGLGPLVRERTGLVIDAYFSGTKLAWLLDHVDGLRRRAEEGEVAFGTVDTWLLHRLTAGAVHATDVTNASRTMLFNLRTMDWDPELLAHLRIPAQVLPAIHPSAAVHGVSAPDVLGAEVPVAALLGDQQAALFAQACFAPGQTKNTYGTGSFVLMHAGRQPFVEQERMLSTVAATLGGAPAEYALEGSIFVTGSAVQWLRDELRIISSAAETEQLARSVPDTGDVWFVPALAGLGAPYWDPHARGMLLGITRGTSRAHIVRAVLESIAFATRDVLDAMQADTGITIGELRADGGAVTNRFLMQHQADVLGIPVDVPTQTESTSLGSGLLAGLTTGVWSSLDELAGVRVSAERYEPAMGDDERETRYARWTQAVARARDWTAERS